jgi:L-ascorbate metabolism protein UlaG (beta-lactamase superfamily)
MYTNIFYIRERITLLVKRLSWAGMLIQSGETVIMVDPLGNTPKGQDKPLAARLGKALEPFIMFDQLPKPTAIAITHVHPDHFDPESIQTAFGPNIPVLVPIESVEIVRKTGLNNVIGTSVGDTVTYGEMKVTAVQSADGFGTPQVAWIIEGEGQKIIHCGDTLWHGYWWRITREFGPLNVACLPINGAVLRVYGLSVQSELHACMTPEEAVEAAKILGVGNLIPIHFGMFNNPPYYIETPNVIERLQNRANERGVNVCLLYPGESIELK